MSKWLKLANLAQKNCTLYTEFFVYYLLSNDNLLKYIFNLTATVDRDYVTEEERLPVLHLSVDFIFFSSGIMYSIVKLWNH